MVDNLAEKVDECPLNRGRLHTIGTTKLLHRVAMCPLFRGCLSTEVNGRTVGTFEIVRYIMGVHALLRSVC